MDEVLNEIFKNNFKGISGSSINGELVINEDLANKIFSEFIDTLKKDDKSEDASLQNEGSEDASLLDEKQMDQLIEVITKGPINLKFRSEELGIRVSIKV